MRQSKYKVKNGEKYGQLMVIDNTQIFIKRRSQNHAAVKCKCDCGGECFAIPRELILKQKTSCHNPTKLGQTKYNIQIGEKFGKLTVISKIFREERGDKKYNKIPVVTCECECGNKVNKKIYQLLGSGRERCSCSNKCSATKHGQSETRLYEIYQGMIDRCRNTTKRPKYFTWSENGVVVCDEWKNDFLTFKKWAEAHGYNDKMTLHRKLSKNYCPESCIWLNRSDHGKMVIFERDNRIKELELENKQLKDYIKSNCDINHFNSVMKSNTNVI